MNQLEKLSDSEVIRRVTEGEKALYELIVRRYNPYLYKVGRSYNYNHEDPQDLMQDTFVDAYKNLGSFEGRSDFKTWIVRIMLNNCFRKKEKSSFKNEVMQDTNDHATPLYSNSRNETDRVVHNRELARVIEKALSHIPEDYRMVFSLREINGMNVAETSQLLNISEANVKVRLNRAKNMLKDEVQKSYLAPELFEFNLVYCNAMVERVMGKIADLNPSRQTP